MSVKITQALLGTLKPGSYDLADREQRGLVLRVRPSGVHSWLVRLGRGKWYTIGRADVVPPAKARESAKKVLGEQVAGVDPIAAKKQAKRQASRTMTLRGFIDGQYATWVRTHQKRGEETLKTLRNRCADFLGTPMSDITPFAVERWRGAYLKRGKAPATVNRVLTALKACLSKAVEWRVVDHHPLAGLKLASVDRIGRLRFLSADEEKRLLAALKARDEKRRAAREHHNAWCRERGVDPWPEHATYTDHVTPLVITLLHTGLRFGEACALTWGDVDLAGKLLTVRGATAKSSRTRYVALNTTATETLKAWKPEKADIAAYVFPGKEAGKPLVDIKTAWREILKDAKVVAFRVHDLRHTFASKLVQAGVDLNTVRELLGHSDIKMTLRYAHLAPEHRAAAVAKIG